MNAQSNQIPSRRRKLLLFTIVAVVPFFALQNGHAQFVATATLTSGGQNNITIGQNGTFILTLGVTTNFVSSGYTVFYRSVNGQGLFQLVGLTYLDPFYMPGPGPSPDPFPGMSGLLNPSNQFDVGASGDQVNNQPPGTFDLQSVIVSVLNAPIGTYTIFLDNRSIMTERAGFNDVNMGGMNGPMFTVHVIPEPKTIALLAMAGAVVSVVIWRQRRAAA